MYKGVRKHLQGIAFAVFSYNQSGGMALKKFFYYL